VFEGFLVGRVGEVVAQLSIEFSEMYRGVCLEIFRYFFQRLKMGGGVVIAEGMIGDDGKALLEEGFEFGM